MTMKSLRSPVILVAILVFFAFLLCNHVFLSSYEQESSTSLRLSRYDTLKSSPLDTMSYSVKYALQFGSKLSTLPTIYLITPTNSRAETQLADLTRLRNTLWLVPKLYWIIVEDSPRPSRRVSNFMKDINMRSVHLFVPTDEKYILAANETRWKKPRGVAQRNRGLKWIRDNAELLDPKGVVYFADDDNTYDIRLFEEMRYTERVSVWPVAFVGELLYERPICRDGKVVDWFTVWGKNRQFPVDMAGFAVNLKLLTSNPGVEFSSEVRIGHQETYFLSQLVNMSDLEPRAHNCTKIYVWHTNTRRVNRLGESIMSKRGLIYDQTIIDEL